MTPAKRPLAEAIRISTLLNLVQGTERFPVPIEEVALEYSRQCSPDAPIDQIKGEDLEGFEGMLKANKAGTKWLILYNTLIKSLGRQRFTIAHEFGHYLLHRQLQSAFTCGEDTIETGQESLRDIEQEADQFASALLMPLDDFRKQLGGQSISFELLDTLRQRYGVSMTAAALKWIDLAPRRAVVVAIRGDQLLWARSNEAAYRSGAVFATRRRIYAVPPASGAHPANLDVSVESLRLPATTWFPKEPKNMPLTELTFTNDTYDYTLALLLMPEAEHPWDREEAEDDDPALELDQAMRSGQFRH